MWKVYAIVWNRKIDRHRESHIVRICQIVFFYSNATTTAEPQRRKRPRYLSWLMMVGWLWAVPSCNSGVKADAGLISIPASTITEATKELSHKPVLRSLGRISLRGILPMPVSAGEPEVTGEKLLMTTAETFWWILLRHGTHNKDTGVVHGWYRDPSWACRMKRGTGERELGGEVRCGGGKKIKAQPESLSER